MPSDFELWSRARGGDARAFGVLYERHVSTIYNYCFRRVADWSAAEDLAAVVFLEAWRRRDKDLPPGKVLPWLLGIATNVVRNHRRSLRRFGAALKRVPQPEITPDFTDDSDRRLDDERLMGEALELLADLPQRQLEVFALCEWFHLSYEDAAEALAIPVGTVRSRLSRSRQHLRELGVAHGHEESDTQSPEEALGHDF